MSPPRTLLPILFVVLGGCEDVEGQSDGLDGALYNPCGADVAPDDCPGGKPVTEGDTPGTGLFVNVIGSEGRHWLDVHTMGCTIEMDSEGVAIDRELCPDCTLVLEVEHITARDGCGIGPITYTTTVGLVPDAGNVGDYTVFISLYEDDWYAVGGATVADWMLRYEAASVYDYAYVYYGGIPNYTFTGEHALILDGMR